MAAEQLVEQAAGRLGHAGVEQRGRGDDQHGAGLGLAGWGWGQLQAEVAVTDPAGLEHIAEGVGTKLLHLGSCRWTLKEPGYPVGTGTGSREWPGVAGALARHRRIRRAGWSRHAPRTWHTGGACADPWSAATAQRPASVLLTCRVVLALRRGGRSVTVAAADFFISYTGADQAWAEWIAEQLEAAGYTTLLQAWDFRPGENFVLW